jgi:Ca2+-binding EF-hand superfamily protein
MLWPFARSMEEPHRMATVRTGRRQRHRLALGAAALASVLAAKALAATTPPPAHPAPQGGQAPRAAAPQAQGQAKLDQFINGVGPLCLKAPARECVDKGFEYADRNHDGKLSLDEAKAVEAEVDAWTQSNAAKLDPEDRQRVLMGLVVIQTVGIDTAFQSYDTNGDGFLSKEELLADVRLDQRPLPQVLADPKSVDWDKLANRAGAAGPLLRRLFPM